MAPFSIPSTVLPRARWHCFGRETRREGEEESRRITGTGSSRETTTQLVGVKIHGDGDTTPASSRPAELVSHLNDPSRPRFSAKSWISAHARNDLVRGKLAWPPEIPIACVVPPASRAGILKLMPLRLVSAQELNTPPVTDAQISGHLCALFLLYFLPVR